jgi:hypothetical protein
MVHQNLQCLVCKARHQQPGVSFAITLVAVLRLSRLSISSSKHVVLVAHSSHSSNQLYSSHANVHSSSRPHYCSVKGCPRGEGGKGFKRKNEMIRHGLVHDSPGYVCPFCPLREHRYPRPDNLQRCVSSIVGINFLTNMFYHRHVRVHHVDKDKDDPLLREVLAQRPEGGGRGRRRRAGPA